MIDFAEATKLARRLARSWLVSEQEALSGLPEEALMQLTQLPDQISVSQSGLGFGQFERLAGLLEHGSSGFPALGFKSCLERELEQAVEQEAAELDL